MTLKLFFSKPTNVPSLTNHHERQWLRRKFTLILLFNFCLLPYGFCLPPASNPQPLTPSPVPLGLPVSLPIPVDNSLTPEKIALGRQLFFDRRLSPNDTMSCAMCHVPTQGFTVNKTRLAVGMNGQSTKRNPPALYNVVYFRVLFHDGREFTLEDQVISPLTSPVEWRTRR